MTTYLMALLIYTSGGNFIQSPAEPKIAESFYFDEKGDIKMNNPKTEDCYFHRQDSVTFKVFCKAEGKSYDAAIVTEVEKALAE